jgi:protein-tyrosine phosphatase
MFRLFGRKEKVETIPLSTDVHSHLLPTIDDGADNLKASLQLIRELAKLGYHKLITTPHVMGDFYRNTPQMVGEKLELVRSAMEKEGIQVELQAAAEYYIDQWMLEQLESNVPLLTFGNGYVLVETSYLTRPPQFEQCIFLIQARGYQPVLAHPERYAFFQEEWKKLERLTETQLLMQINLASLTGYYGKGAQFIAERLIDRKKVHFAGSDCHSLKHISILHEARAEKYYQKLLQLPLLNHQL